MQQALPLTPPAPADPALSRLLDVRRIYVEPAAAALPRGQEVLARWPDAELVEVLSHQAVPYTAEDVDRWVRIKTEDLVLGVKKSLTARPNGRSSDFIAPSTANGCAMACAYCYVPRRKGYANPVTVFANIEQITRYLGRHVGRQGTKQVPDQVDPLAWVYDIGENSDCSVDARLSDNVRDLVDLFRGLPTAKASFATKHVNRDLLDWDPQGRTRIRFSLMPAADSRLLDLRTSPIAERLAAIDDFVAAGYEVHVNLSPVVVARRLARGLGGAALRPGRRHGRRVQGAGRRRGHLPDPQRPAARGQPRLAPEGRGGALAPGAAGAQAVADRRLERPLPHRLQGPAGARAHRPHRRAHPLAAGPLRVLAKAASASA